MKLTGNPKLFAPGEEGLKLISEACPSVAVCIGGERGDATGGLSAHPEKVYCSAEDGGMHYRAGVVCAENCVDH